MNNGKKFKFEIREVDAWTEPGPDDGSLPAWTWNTSYYIGDMETAAAKPQRALAAWLKKRGIVFYAARVRYHDDGDVIEIQDRKTGEPIYAAIPRY